MEPTTSSSPTPTAPPQPKLLERPLVKDAIRIAVAVLLAWLAAKGIRLPSETLPPVNVSVSYPPPAPAK